MIIRTIYDEIATAHLESLYDYVQTCIQAEQVSRMAQSAIFAKHRLADGGYGPGLKDELRICRQVYANKWGPSGWQHEVFVKWLVTEFRIHLFPVSDIKLKQGPPPILSPLRSLKSITK